MEAGVHGALGVIVHALKKSTRGIESATRDMIKHEHLVIIDYDHFYSHFLKMVVAFVKEIVLNKILVILVQIQLILVLTLLVLQTS